MDKGGFGMEWDRLSSWMEPVAWIVMVILAGSLIQGMLRGASGSARRLFFFIWEGVLIIVSLALAGRTAAWLSPLVEARMKLMDIRVPAEDMSVWMQTWYTFITSVRDFALLRFGILFLIGYLVLRLLLGLLTPVAAILAGSLGLFRDGRRESMGGRAASRAAGAAFGAVIGAGRGMLLLAALFIYVSLVPDGPFASAIQSSPVYRQTAEQVMEPVAGDVIAKQGPVIAKAVESEFRKVLQRKYEIIDYAIPADIGQAALSVTKDQPTATDKARALYDWLGSRIAYDWDKARNYEQRGVWKEQTPEETFKTRKGVCIDTARLYAVMARAAGLEVRVVTGSGADGQGNYVPHAWNEVKLENGKWIPLDATWAPSGDWFNPPQFDNTHIREA
jgi:hypothetical protein